MFASPPRFHLLGSVGINVEAEPRAVGGVRQQALLARLLLEEGRVVGVDQLIEDVWAGHPPTSALNTLRSYISLLRRAVGDPDAVRREGSGYRLVVAEGDLDAARFEQLLEAARALDTDAATRLAHLDDALALWRGPALDEVADLPFARGSATRLEELRLVALEERAQALLALGRHNEAASELAALVEEHPLRERLTELLVVALYRSGRQVDALRAYERTRRVLVDELGLEPGPALRALERQVLVQDPALGLDAPMPRPTARATPDIPFGPLPLPPLARHGRHEPFVGRREELAVLERRWSEAAKGTQGMVVLSGEPGIGKTRLASVLAHLAARDGGTVLWGRCPRDAHDPYAPLVEALRRALRSITAGGIAALVDDPTPLRRLLPDAGEVTTTEADTDRLRLFDTTVELLRALASTAPVLLVVDDLHWVDHGSAALLTHLLREPGAMPLLVVATARSTDADPNPSHLDLLTDLSRAGRVEHITLRGLDAGETAELVAALGGHADGGLRTTTGGNPFFVEELVALGGVEEVPANIRDVLTGRLARLGPEVADMLTAAAILGSDIDLDVLALLTGLDTDDLLDQVDTAVGAELLVEAADAVGRYSFAHALVQQVLLADLGRTRLSRLHLRAAEAIESARPGGALAAIAHHRLAALPLGAAESALEAAIAAAQHALDRLAPEDATATVDHAFARLAAIGLEIAPATRFELLQLRGAAANSVGDRPTARAAHLEADDLAADPVQRADAVLGLAASKRPYGFDDYGEVDTELLDRLERALTDLGDADPERRVRLLARQTTAQLHLSGRGADAADEAVAVAGRTGDPRLVAVAQIARRTAAWHPGGIATRLDASDAAVDAALAAADPDLEADARMVRLIDRFEIGRVDDGLADAERVDVLARARRRTPLLTVAPSARALEALLRGRYEEVLRLAEEIVVIAGGFGVLGVADGYAIRRFLVARDLGHGGDEYGRLDAAFAGRPSDMTVRMAVGVAAAESGDLTAAAAIAAEVGVLQLPSDAFWLATAAFGVDVAVSTGDATAAADLAQAIAPFAGQFVVDGSAFMLGSVDHHLGCATLAAGDPAGAVGHLDRAIAAHTTVAATPWLARSLAVRAEAAAVLGDDPTEFRRRAAALAATVGLVLPAPRSA